MGDRAHWDSIYQNNTDDDVSWTQTEPSMSMSLIREACPHGRVVDIGGGASQLAERLLDAGYSVAVLDISNVALARSRARLAARADEVQWFSADVTESPVLDSFDVWHDRAVYHFLTDPRDRQAYADLLRKTVTPGGHAIIATFALDGPDKCSGLAVQRYSPASLLESLGSGFKLLKSMREIHRTPQGKEQSFQFSVLRRVA